MELKDQKIGMLTVQNFGGYKGKKTKVHKKGRAFWNCLCDCGKETEVAQDALIAGNTKSCGCLRKRRGKNSSAWKNGRTVSGNGYIVIYKPEHPLADNKGYVYEHRLMAIEILGRPLKKGEEVHHVDADRKNNKKENLVVFDTRSDHMSFEAFLRRIRKIGKLNNYKEE